MTPHGATGLPATPSQKIFEVGFQKSGEHQVRRVLGVLLTALLTTTHSTVTLLS